MQKVGSGLTHPYDEAMPAPRSDASMPQVHGVRESYSVRCGRERPPDALTDQTWYHNSNVKHERKSMIDPPEGVPCMR
jgi:hypothetical protein